jgi:putative ABC transport system permease protein
MRAEVRVLDRNLPVFRMETVESIVEETLHQPRLYALLTACFAIVALLLAALGIYGVMAYSVAQRTREIGVRLALGATRAEILRMVLRQTGVLALFGIVLGAILSVPATRLAATFLFGVHAYDPLSYLAGAMLILLCSGLACWLPAWRASRVDPMPALRAD